MTTKTIVFDFGGVLFRSSATELYRERFEKSGRTEEQLQYFLKNIFTDAERSSSHIGDVSDLIERKAAQHPEWAEDIRAFGADQAFRKQARNVLPGAKDMLDELAAEGYRIVGLTNWAGDAYDVLPGAYPDIMGHFNKVVVSGKVHMRKPDADIFHLAQAEFGNPDVSEVYFFDDKPANIEAARKAVGWKSFVFEGPDTVKRALALPFKPS